MPERPRGSALPSKSQSGDDDRISKAGYRRNTVTMTIGHGVRVVAQSVLFILLARMLSADGYGAFAGILGFVGIWAPFVGWGMGHILVKRVALDPARFGEYFAKSLIASLISALVFLPMVFIASNWLLPENISRSAVLAITASELLFTTIVLICSQAFQAFERMGMTIGLLAGLSVFRLLGLLVAWSILESLTLLSWAVVYVVVTLVAAVTSVISVIRLLGVPTWRHGGWNELGAGWTFALGQAAYRTHHDADKALLIRLSSAQDAGLYSAANRIADVAFVPIGALLASSYAKFFQYGDKGVREGFALARRLMPGGFLYALSCAAGLWILAPFVPVLLGADFSESTQALRVVAVLPVIGLFRFLAASVLTGAGYQRSVMHVEWAAAGSNIGINVLLIPSMGWLGAAVSTVVTQSIAMVALWILFLQASEAQKSVSRKTNETDVSCDRSAEKQESVE